MGWKDNLMTSEGTLEQPEVATKVLEDIDEKIEGALKTLEGMLEGLEGIASVLEEAASLSEGQVEDHPSFASSHLKLFSSVNVDKLSFIPWDEEDRMTNRKGSLSKFFLTSSILIENARGIPDICVVLQEFGYSPERLAEGFQLLLEAQTLVHQQAREYGEAREATDLLNKARETANAAYRKTLKIARIAFGDEVAPAVALKLYGPRKQSKAGWVEQTSAFYGNLTDPHLQDRLEQFGYTASKIAKESALVEAVRQSFLSQAKETGEAQQATVVRDQKVAQLETWVSELRAVSRVAFAENPQGLERLGIKVLNAPRAKKKSTAAG